MTKFQVDPSDRSTILVHYYRAMVGRADVWRMRMDTTTNWAIGSTAAVVSFTLGNPTVPHFVVHFASLMTIGFLLLEARRLTFYHLWQQRVLLMENGLIRPAVMPHGAEPQAYEEATAASEAPEPELDLAEALDANLGRTVPTMSRLKAAARRLRRVYLYLFAVQVLAWSLKLSIHPGPSGSLAEFIGRAHIGVVPGGVTAGLTAVAFLGASVLAFMVGGVDRDPA